MIRSGWLVVVGFSEREVKNRKKWTWRSVKVIRPGRRCSQIAQHQLIGVCQTVGFRPDRTVFSFLQSKIWSALDVVAMLSSVSQNEWIHGNSPSSKTNGIVSIQLALASLFCFFFCKKQWVKLFAEPRFVKTNKQTKKQKKNVADREVIGDYRRKWKPIKWVL